MQRLPSRVLGSALLITLVLTGGALAGPLKGKTYKAHTATKGMTSDGASFLFEPPVVINLKVAANGKTVTAALPDKYEILFCNTGIMVSKRNTSRAAISSTGRFKAVLHDTLKGAPEKPTQVVTGTFSGKKVTGTLRTEAGVACSGSVKFTGSAK